MTAEEIKQLIEFLPNIIMYIIPGYIFIKVYRYILDVKSESLRNAVIEYVLGSYIIILFCKLVYYVFRLHFDINANGCKIIICFISLVSGYLISRLIQTQMWISFMKFMCINKSNSSNIFRDIIDNEYGTWVRIYLPSEKIIYDGAFIKFEYKGTYQESFIILSDFCTYSYGNGQVDKDWFTDESSGLSHVAIKVSEISRIEITYSPNSKKVPSDYDKDSTNIDQLIRKKIDSIKLRIDDYFIDKK